MKAEYRKVISDILHKPRVPRKIKEQHLDIEDAIVEAGGVRGAYGRDGQ